MSDVTWPEVVLLIALFVFVLGSLAFLAWLAKYWDVFGDKK